MFAPNLLEWAQSGRKEIMGHSERPQEKNRQKDRKREKGVLVYNLVVGRRLGFKKVVSLNPSNEYKDIFILI